MGQHASTPLERPSTSISVYEPALEYINDPSLKNNNTSNFVWTPPGVNRSLHEFFPDPDLHTGTDSDETPTPAKYQYTDELMQEAKLQFRTCRGLFWELALLKLRDNFLHPVDLTEGEFLDFVSVSDIDAWLDQHRHKLISRVIWRRATAHQALKDAGIDPLELGGIEMFELMNDAERAAFIGEYKSRRRDLDAELKAAAREDRVSCCTTPDFSEDEDATEMEAFKLIEEFNELDDFRELQDLKQPDDYSTLDYSTLDEADASETLTIKEMPPTTWPFQQRCDSLDSRHPNPSPMRRKFLGSLGAAFLNRKPRDASSSGTTDPPLKTGEARKSINLSRRLGRSVRSIRVVFGQKRKTFKRAALGGDLYST